MVIPLSEQLPDIARRLGRSAHLLVLLDYDGTLTPLVDRPQNAFLDARLRETIATLARKPRCTVAILSGRALEDVRERVGIDGLIYAGNHGLEIEGPGLSFLCAAAAEEMQSMHELAGQLMKRFRSVPGVLVEDKRLTLSIHHRLVPEGRMTEFRAILADTVSALNPCFQVTEGNKVHEIRPRAEWNKGIAAVWIRQQSCPGEVLSIYLGDDRTDEDAFAVLKEGITVKVGNSSDTAADYSLDSPRDVARFLEWLIDADKC